MSVPPKPGGFPAQAQGSHLAHDTGVHTTWPTHPARALESPANACSAPGPLLARATCLWHTAGGWHSYFWANPERTQKQGVQDWELLEGKPCVGFTPGAQDPPPGLA